MIQRELDLVITQHRRWLRDKRFGSRADFTGSTMKNLDISNKYLSGAIFDDTGLFSCDFSNSDLSNIAATGVHFFECNFTNVSLRNARLQQARYTLSTFSNTDLWDVSGDGVYIIYLQLGGYNVCYPSEVLQINCLQFDIKKVWWMSDDDVLARVETYKDFEMVKMAEWWTQWKYQIYQIVNSCPAKPINSPK